jgi:predicted metal-dependent hydrolase
MTEEPARVVKVERPRDEFGRPLPAGSVNRLHLEDFDVLPLAEVEALARSHFNAGRYFGAHEAWETVWRQERGSDDEEFFKGLSQIGAGYTHYLRGNAHGARALLERGLGRIEAYGPRHRDIDVEGLLRAGLEHLSAVAEAERSGGPLPHLDPSAA